LLIAVTMSAKIKPLDAWLLVVDAFDSLVQLGPLNKADEASYLEARKRAGLNY